MLARRSSLPSKNRDSLSSRLLGRVLQQLPAVDDREDELVRER